MITQAGRVVQNAISQVLSISPIHATLSYREQPYLRLEEILTLMK